MRQKHSRQQSQSQQPQQYQGRPGQSQLQAQPKQQQQQQAVPEGASEQREEGEVPDYEQKYGELLSTCSGQRGDLEAMSEELAQVKAALAAQARQHQLLQQLPSPQALAELASQVAALQDEARVKDAALAAAHAEIEAARQALAAAGFTDAAAAQDMHNALSNGAHAYVEVQQLRDEHQQQQRRVTELETGSSTQGSQLASLRAEVTQLKQQIGLESSRAEFVAWGPGDYSPDRMKHDLSAAMGVSSNVIVTVERRWAPQPPDRGAGSSGCAAAAAATTRDGGAAGPSTGAAVGHGAGSSGSGGGPQGPRQGRNGQPLALYMVTLCSGRFLHAALGGKCRMYLRSKQLPIWVDKALSEEERAERRRLAPVFRQLKADGVRVRWQGTRLEQQVQRSGGRTQWQAVDPLPPAEVLGAAEQAAGGGAGEGR